MVGQEPLKLLILVRFQVPQPHKQNTRNACVLFMLRIEIESNLNTHFLT